MILEWTSRSHACRGLHEFLSAVQQLAFFKHYLAFKFAFPDRQADFMETIAERHRKYCAGRERQRSISGFASVSGFVERTVRPHGSRFRPPPCINALPNVNENRLHTSGPSHPYNSPSGHLRPYHFIREMSQRHSIALFALSAGEISSEARNEMANWTERVLTFDVTGTEGEQQPRRQYWGLGNRSRRALKSRQAIKRMADCLPT